MLHLPFASLQEKLKGKDVCTHRGDTVIVTLLLMANIS